MGMANGESGICFGTDVGKWGAKEKQIFYRMCLDSKCFCGEFKCG